MSEDTIENPGFTPGSKLDKWFKHLTEQLGHEPSEEEFCKVVLADGKPCQDFDRTKYVRGKRPSEQIQCGRPGVGWILSLMSGPEVVCVDHDPKFLGLPAPRVRPTDFEPDYYEGV